MSFYGLINVYVTCMCLDIISMCIIGYVFVCVCVCMLVHVGMFEDACLNISVEIVVCAD